jgi:hypothetical protein
MKKCPPGVICLENITMLFIVISFIILFYIGYLFLENKKEKIPKGINNQNTNPSLLKERGPRLGFFPNIPYNNDFIPEVSGNVLLNPYAPPLRDERFLIPSMQLIPPGTIPINIATNVGAVDTSYRQVGILTPLNGSSKDSILPLMGRPLFVNRDKWQYYTISNQHNNVKLPVSKGGKSCTNEYGCDKIYNGNSVYIDGANDVYKVTIYDNDVIKYLPFV